MAEAPCNFCWYELATSDVESATRFYAAVLGWGAQGYGQPPNAGYTILSAASRGIGGVVEMPEFARGVPPVWIGYVAVPDADQAASRVASAGGAIHRPPAEIPGIGRYAVVADPQGAVFTLMAPFPTEVPPPVPDGTPGHPAWRELYAVDWQAALGFYGQQFGWTAADAVSMGAMGTYQTFAAGGAAIGGMMNKPDVFPLPFWLYYFWVDAIDDAVERVKSNGGEILHGPSSVPGGGQIIQARDPQGAMFGLVTAPAS